MIYQLWRLGSKLKYKNQYLKTMILKKGKSAHTNKHFKEEKLSPKFSMAMVILSVYHAFLILKCTSLVIGHNTTETWTFVRLLKVNRSNIKHQLPCLSFSISPMSSCASQVLTSLFTHYRLTLFANVSFLPLWDLKSFKEIVCFPSA